MADRRDAEDARWQRLANLAIGIRMLKARVQAASEEHEFGATGWRVRDANVAGTRREPRCPHCGYTAGLARLPREYRRHSTLVRCFACQRDSAAFNWTAQAAPPPEGGRNTAGSRPPR